MSIDSELSHESEIVGSILSTIRDSRRIQIGVLIGPISIILLGFFISPLILMGWISVLTELPPAPITVNNYIEIFTSDLYTTVLWKTVTITVPVTVTSVALGYILTYAIVRVSSYPKLLLILVILPFWTNYIVRSYAWINILQEGGVLDQILLALNLISESQGYMYSYWTVFIGFVYSWLPFAVVPIYSSLTQMDFSQIEASYDLGSGPLRTFYHITLPQTIGGIIAAFILVGIPTFGSFVLPALLGGTGQIMIGEIIEQQFTTSFNWPLGSALGVITSVLVILTVAIAAMSGKDISLFKTG